MSSSQSQPTPQRPLPTPSLGAARSGSAELSSLQQLADMDVDEDSLVVDQEAPTEKTDADFFNGELSQQRTTNKNACPPACPELTGFSLARACYRHTQTLTTTLTTKTWSELRRQRLLPGTKVPGVRTRELFRSSGDGTRCSTPREVPAP